MGLTQQDLGVACGVRFQQIQKYESASNRMSAAVLWRLAKVLQVDVRYFFDGLEISTRPSDARLIQDDGERSAR